MTYKIMYIKHFVLLLTTEVYTECNRVIVSDWFFKKMCILLKNVLDKSCRVLSSALYSIELVWS